ncbi:hypothetical protein ES319_D01G038700v1 [Gossypium barbadense]|uniref:Ubiquitin-like protease family profile domain-containing protein n=1 Tax=Gossypium barbadense TaxID=3634 RepID=A0A5J5SJJ8_GOSBA|nr:hypothetical protein ES319_D01G038700v1 [Gossypium barbadense]
MGAERGAAIPPSAIRLLASHCSQLVKSNGKRLFLIDTLALVRGLEAEGLPSKQAEAITATMTEVLNDSLENVSLSVVSKFEMQKSEMTQESNLSKLKSEVQSSQLLRKKYPQFGQLHGVFMQQDAEECWTQLLYTLSQSLRSAGSSENIDTVKDLFGIDLASRFDCGTFMLKYIDFYSKGLSLCFEQEHMPYFRLRTAKEILKLKAD